MTFELEFDPRAWREWKKLGDTVRQQFKKKLVEVLDNMEEFADLLWNSLNEENKVSLFVRYIDIETGNYETKIVNKNK